MAKFNHFSHPLFTIIPKYFNKDSYITLSQIKTIDSKRFIEKIWKISNEDYLDIKNKIKNLF